MSENDPIDLYITAAHCIYPDGSLLVPVLYEQKEYANQNYVDYVIHPTQDLAIFTPNKLSNHPKYSLYRGKPQDLVNKMVTNVAFGTSSLSRNDHSKRNAQAFDSIVGSIEEGNLLLSTSFMPDLNIAPEDNPIGVITRGDSGGTLLFQTEGQYKLVGVVHGWDKPKEDYKSFYENIPEHLKSNSQNQKCVSDDNGKLYSTPNGYSHKDSACYGAKNIWEFIDVKFIEDAQRDLLVKKTVYAWSQVANFDYPMIEFSLKNGICYKRRHLFDNGSSSRAYNLIGYARSEDTNVVVIIEGKEFFAIPLKVGNTHFVYQSAGKHYPVQIAIEESTDGKSFSVKGIIHSEEGIICSQELNECKQCTPDNLIDNLIAHGNQHNKKIPSFAKPVYLNLRQDTLKDLPLEISVDKCLSATDYTDIGFPVNARILGYVGNTYELVFSLNGQELRRINNIEFSNRKTSFEYQHFGASYKVEISKLEKQFNSPDDIILDVKVTNLLEKESYSLAETSSAFPHSIPACITRSSGMAGDIPVSIKLSEETAEYLELFIANDMIQKLPIKEGIQHFPYENNGVDYTIEINVQKFDVPGEHYKIDLTVKESSEFSYFQFFINLIA